MSKIDPEEKEAITFTFVSSTAIAKTVVATGAVVGISVLADDIVESYTSLISKMNAEIERIKEKNSKKDGITYQLQIRKLFRCKREYYIFRGRRCVEIWRNNHKKIFKVEIR